MLLAPFLPGGSGGLGPLLTPRLETDGRKSHDRADSLTGSHGAQWPGTAGATAGAMANGGFVEKGPLVGMYARHVTAALSLSAFLCDWLPLFCGKEERTALDGLWA